MSEDVVEKKNTHTHTFILFYRAVKAWISLRVIQTTLVAEADTARRRFVSRPAGGRSHLASPSELASSGRDQSVDLCLLQHTLCFYNLQLLFVYRVGGRKSQGVAQAFTAR